MVMSMPDEAGTFPVKMPDGSEQPALYVVADGMIHVTFWIDGAWRQKSGGQGPGGNNFVLRDLVRALLRQHAS